MRHLAALTVILAAAAPLGAAGFLSPAYLEDRDLAVAVPPLLVAALVATVAAYGWASYAAGLEDGRRLERDLLRVQSSLSFGAPPGAPMAPEPAPALTPLCRTPPRTPGLARTALNAALRVTDGAGACVVACFALLDWFGHAERLVPLARRAGGRAAGVGVRLCGTVALAARRLWSASPVECVLGFAFGYRRESVPLGHCITACIDAALLRGRRAPLLSAEALAAADDVTLYRRACRGGRAGVQAAVELARRDMAALDRETVAEAADRRAAADVERILNTYGAGLAA